MVILSLLVTDIFIFLYNYLLIFLNTKVPVEASKEFIRAGAVPEPFEIPLYLIISFILVVLLYLLHLKRHVKSSNPSSYLKIAVFIFLLLTFLSNLGSYPMARSIFPLSARDASLTYILFFTVTMLTTCFIVIQANILESILKKNKVLKILVFLFALFLISLITLDPQFNIYGHDYSYFFGPVWEILHGKTIYTQTPSQYGFLSILVLTLLHKLNILNILYLPVIVWLFYIIEYFLYFHIIYKVSRSFSLSFLGLFSLMIINYLSSYHVPSLAPQIGPMRWLPLIVCLFMLVEHKKITSWFFVFLTAMASLWVLDSGIYLIMAYGTTLFILTLIRQISLKSLILSLLFLIISLVTIFTLINLLHLLFGYQSINPFLIFSKLKQYGSAGFGMLPFDNNTYFWLVPLIYFTSIIYFFRNNFQDRLGSTLLLFSANLSLFASVYFVGRSHPHNLFHLSLFPLLNLSILLCLFFKNRFSNFFFLISFTLLIAFPFYQRQETITNNLKQKIKVYMSGNILTREWWYGLKSNYKNEIDLIKKNVPDDKIVILSPDDTYLFYLTNKGNLMHDNSQFTILTQKDLDFSLQDVYKSCPQKIVAECTLFNHCQNRKPFTEIAGFNIQPLLLTNIEKNCKVKYQEQTCTDKLCIVDNGK